MNCGVVQQVFAAGDAQKAGALLKGLGPQLGRFQQRLAVGEGAVFRPIGRDVFGHGFADARDPLQQGGGGGVEIHAHSVDAILHHAVQGLAQPGLGHIVLILPHADGFGVDLHQLRQRVLEAAGDGNRRTQRHVKLRKLLSR